MQLYYRGNYHWYLKQQWAAPGLHCLGFDTEIVCRIFMAQYASMEKDDVKPGREIVRDTLRVADFSWDVMVSGTADGSIAVTDGCSLLLTPLSLNTVPPPMSMYRHQLTSPCKHSFFWPTPVPGGTGWGLACLSGENIVTLIFADGKGMPQRQTNVDVAPVIAAIRALEDRTYMKPSVVSSFNLRGIAATQPIEVDGDGGAGTGDVVYVLLYGSRELHGNEPNRRLTGDKILPTSALASDQIILLEVRAVDGSVLSANQIRLFPAFDHYSADSDGEASVSRVTLWPNDPTCLAVSLISCEKIFLIHRVCVVGLVDVMPSDMEKISPECVLRRYRHLTDYTGVSRVSRDRAVQSPAEPCVQIAVIPASVAALVEVDTRQYASYLQQNTVVIGLTSRGKLYCGEILLVAGVSSFAVNYPLEVLLYISTGTRPLLHYCSFKSLR